MLYAALSQYLGAGIVVRRRRLQLPECDATTQLREVIAGEMAAQVGGHERQLAVGLAHGANDNISTCMQQVAENWSHDTCCWREPPQPAEGAHPGTSAVSRNLRKRCSVSACSTSHSQITNARHLAARSAAKCS